MGIMTKISRRDLPKVRRPWPVPGLIPPNYTVLTGRGAVGFMPHLAAQMNSGRSFTGEPLPHAGLPVVFVRTRPGQPCPAILNGTFVLEGDFRIDDPTSIEIMVSIIRRAGKHQVLFLDNLAGFLGDLSARSVATAGRVAMVFDRIRAELGCAIVTTHPSNRSGESLRRSSEFTCAPDAILAVEMRDRSVTITPKKFRNAALTGSVTFELS